MFDEAAKKILYDSIFYHNNIKYKLYSFVIMNDHVHIILQPNEVEPGKCVNLSEIMHSIKSYAAKEIMKHLQNEKIGSSFLPEKIF